MNHLSISCVPAWTMRGAVAAVAMVSLQATLTSPVMAQASAIPNPVLTKAGPDYLSIGWTNFTSKPMVQYGTSANGPFTTISSSGTSGTISGLQPNTTYYVRLTGLPGQYETYGKALPFKTAGALPVVPAPTLSKASPNALTLSWSPYTGANNYLVKWRLTPTSANTEVAAGASGVTLSGLTPNTSYEVQLVARQLGAWAYASNYVKFTTAAAYAPPRLTASALTTAPNINDPVINLSWTAYPGATSYEVFSYLDAQGTVSTDWSSLNYARSPSNPARNMATTAETVSYLRGTPSKVMYARVVAYGPPIQANGFPTALSASSLVKVDFTAAAPAPTATPAPAPVTTWTALPGAAKDIGAGGASNGLWVVGTDAVQANGFNVYRWANNTWQLVPNTGAVRLDVDAQGNAWTVNNKGAVQRYDGTKWVAVPGVTATDIGVGANGTVWSLGAAIDAAGNYAIYRLNGTSWAKMSGQAVRVDVDATGNAWVVNKAGDVFRWNGNTWVVVPGVKTSDVGVGADGSVFVLGTDSKVYRWSGSAWVVREGAAVNISVSATGVPYAADAAGKIYRGVK